MPTKTDKEPRQINAANINIFAQQVWNETTDQTYEFHFQPAINEANCAQLHIAETGEVYFLTYEDCLALIAILQEMVHRANE